MDRLRIGVCRGDLSVEEIKETMLHYKAEFKRINVADPKIKQLNAIIIAFPDIDLKDAHAKIDWT